MSVERVWRIPARRDAEITLYTMLRMMHIRGWSSLVVGVEPDGRTWIGVRLAPHANEEDARDWSALFAPRYLVNMTIDELIADPRRFDELYLDGGVAAFLREHERQLERDAETRARWRGAGGGGVR